jgi:predicted dehydrogenase
MVNKNVGEKIKVGVIGLGGAGRAHVRRLNRNPLVKEVFGFDIKEITDVKGVTIVKSRDELLSKVDAVTICTPDEQHLDDIIACLKSGKHVLTEKPMTASLDQAKKLAPYLKRYPNLVFGVHHQMRGAPPFIKARELIKQGKLGDLFYVEANYWHDMRDRASMFDKWRDQEGQSLIFAHGCHPADLLMYLTDQEPTKHTTYISKNSFTEYSAPYTSATSIMQFPNNVIGKIHVNSSCIFPQVYDLIILGNKGTYIDGILYTADTGFKQVAGFFGNNDWLNTEMIITKIKIPAKLLSILINAYIRTYSKIISVYISLFSKLTLSFMREADFGFRRFPFTAYNHDWACQYMINNFIATILGKEKIIAGYPEATRVIALCEEMEKNALSSFPAVKKQK